MFLVSIESSYRYFFGPKTADMYLADIVYIERHLNRFDMFQPHNSHIDLRMLY